MLGELTSEDWLLWTTFRDVAWDPADKPILVANGRSFPIARFQTEDYAYLSVRLPEAECEMFQPWLKLSHPIGTNDVMVVGVRKPLLNAAKDRARLEQYESAFRASQREFAVAIRP